MGRYDSHKHPFQYQMNLWSQKRVNDRLERVAKSIPCHVVAVDKDFITVAFENQNGIFTPPTVKIPQSFSQYAREPTQVGDKGYAVPGNYYLGGVSGMAGGNTDFYPRGNLTSLSFQPISHTTNPSRDYNQLTHMGGPNGWIVGPYQQQSQSQQSTTPSPPFLAGSSGRVMSSNFREQQAKMRRALPVKATTSSSGSSGSSGGGSSDSTQFSFDQNGMCTVQSKDTKHLITVDQQNQKITIQVPVGEKIYVGGDGKEGAYDQVVTQSGPCVNVWGRIS